MVRSTVYYDIKVGNLEIMHNLEDNVNVNEVTCMPTTPTTNSELKVELGPPMIPVANGAVLMPASSLLSQTTDVLYTHNSQ